MKVSINLYIGHVDGAQNRTLQTGDVRAAIAELHAQDHEGSTVSVQVHASGGDAYLVLQAIDREIQRSGNQA